MNLSSDLISQFAKINNDTGSSKSEEVTLYGTIVQSNDELYVKLDGSNELTPMLKTVTVKAGERVSVVIKNHSAIVTGNLSDPSASSDDLNDLANKVIEATESITLLVKNGEEFSELKQTLESFSFFSPGGVVKIKGGDIELTGAISWADLDDDAQEAIDAIDTKAGNAASNASSALSVASSASSTASSAWSRLSSWTASGTTYIDGSMIWSDSIYADSIHLGGALTVYQNTYSNSVGGYLGYDSGFSSSSGIGVRYSSDGPQCVCTNVAARLSYGLATQVVCGANTVTMKTQSGTGVIVMDYQAFRPDNTGGLYLGTSAHPWKAVYATNDTIQASDRNKKNTIEDLSEKYVTFFDNLTPRRYKFNDGTSDRYHVGYISQEVEAAMKVAGVDSLEFAGFVKDKDEDGNDIYMLRYDEFEGIYHLKIQQLEARYEAKISDLEARIAELEKRLT